MVKEPDMWRLQLINEVLTSREATTYMYLLGIILENAKPCYSRCVAVALSGRRANKS